MSKAPEKGQKMQALYALHWVPNLSPSARVVGAWLVWHANASTGRCDPGQARLRAETGLSPRTIQYAIDRLVKARVVNRTLRGGETSSYQINWATLTHVVTTYEARAKGRSVVVEPAERGSRGRNKLRGGDAKDCASQAQEIAPKPTEVNTQNIPMFRGGTIEDGVLSEDAVPAKIIGIEADHAFLAVLDREARKGRRFSREIADAIYERLDAICDIHEHHRGDPIGGRAYRLREADFYEEGEVG